VKAGEHGWTGRFVVGSEPWEVVHCQTFDEDPHIYCLSAGRSLCQNIISHLTTVALNSSTTAIPSPKWIPVLMPWNQHFVQ